MPKSLCSLRSVFALILFTGLLGGCTTFHSKDIDPEQTRAHLENRGLDDPGLEAFLGAHGRSADQPWDLDKLTLAAFFFSPALESARAEYAATVADVASARALPNPSFGFAPGYNVDAAPGVTPWILDFALDVPLELAGRRKYRTAEAGYQAEVARLHLASAAWAVRSAVRQALVEMNLAAKAAEIWRTQNSLLTEAIKIVDTQVQVGEASPLEVAQTRLALNRAELSSRESERALDRARINLAEAMGVPSSAISEVRISEGNLAQPLSGILAADARSWAARNRSDLLASLATYAAVQAALQGEVARQYPDITIGPGYQLDQGEGKWSLGVGLTLPIFHQNQGPIAAAEARREAAAARFLNLQNQVLAEVDRSLADLASAANDLTTVGLMRTSLDQQAKTIGEQYAIGETSRLELARAKIELSDIMRIELEATVRVERALGALEDAVQRPLPWPESSWSQPHRHAATN